MGGYIGSSVGNVANAAERKQTYSITTTTTSLTGLAYTPTKVHVFHNGVRLVDGSDYTATNGTSITLTNAAQNGDEVVVISYPSFQTSDTVSAANGGTFAGNIAMSGNLGVTGATTLTGSLSAKGGAVFNEDSADVDFRVESNDNANMLVVNGGDNAVGIGIDSPSTMLHLFDGGTDTGLTIQSKVAANATSSITMMSRKSDNSNMNAVIQNDAGAFTFDTNSTERLRITSGGDLRVGINSDMGGVINASHADGVAIGSANDQTYYRRIYGTSGANLELRFWNGSNEGSLNSSGAWVNASDVSLKENIADIEYGIDTVKSLKPRKYTMKEGGNSEVGFIAQEMESVVPEVVDTSENPNKDEIKGISYGQLTAVLTKALQEAIAKIETLETKVAALEAE